MEKYEDLKIPAWGYLLICIGSYIGLNIISVIFSLILKATCSEEFITANYNFLNVLLTCGCYLIVAIILAIVFRKSLKDIFSRIQYKNTWKWVLIGYAILCVGNYLYSYTLNAFNITSSSANQDSLIEMVGNNPLLSGLYICILAPVLEEIMFRLGLFRFLEKKNEWLALILTTILFAGMHMIASIEDGTLLADLSSLPTYLIGAFALTFTYMKSKSLLASTSIHIINNTLSFALILLSTMAA